MRVLCKFTRDTSLIFEGTRMTVVGGPRTDWFDFHDYGRGSISQAVNLDEGIVHVLFDSGALFQIDTDPASGFMVRKVRG